MNEPAANEVETVGVDAFMINIQMLHPLLHREMFVIDHKADAM